MRSHTSSRSDLEICIKMKEFERLSRNHTVQTKCTHKRATEREIEKKSKTKKETIDVPRRRSLPFSLSFFLVVSSEILLFRLSLFSFLVSLVRFQERFKTNIEQSRANIGNTSKEPHVSTIKEQM